MSTSEFSRDDDDVDVQETVDNIQETTEVVTCQSSAEALKFLDNIQNEDYTYLLFPDQLLTTSDTGRELGEFIVSVVQGLWQGQDCLVVHANSHGAIDSVPCGTSIVAYVTKRLDTLEQEHHEYVKLANCSLDRKTTVVQKDGGITVNRIISQGEDVTRVKKVFTKDQSRGFISEGSNLLLHRLLITKGIPDNCVFMSFDSDANLCPASYSNLEERVHNVEDKQIQVYGIERTIVSNTDLSTTWQSYFTKDGFLVSRVQIGSPVVMRLGRLPADICRDGVPPKPTVGKSQLSWCQDMELFSMFTERKAELLGEHGKYIRDHPDLRSILADFVQYLLIHKPQSVVPFAASYFASFGGGPVEIGSFISKDKAPPSPPESAKDGTSVHTADVNDI